MPALLALPAACSSASAPPGPPTPASARAVLAAQSRAVLAHDARGFLAQVDGSAAARAYRAAAAREIAGLAGVPLAAWRYDVAGTVHDAAAQRAAARRYGAPALLLHVVLGYELGGIDTVPSAHELYLTFVRRGDRTLLAGDDALAAEGSPSWHGPWDFGPLVAARGRTSLVLGRPGEDALLRTLAADVDAAVTAVSRVWGPDWARRVAVLVPASPAQFQASGGAVTAGDSAAAVTEGVDPVTGRPYGQRLVLNPGRLERLSPVGRGIVLRHEITHLAAAASTSDVTPRWVVEGFADYVGNLGSGQPVSTAASELRAAVGRGALPTALPGDAAFAAGGAALAAVYEQSWLACRLIARRVGQAGLVRFYRAVGSALEPAAPAVAGAFAAVLHESEQAFTRQWRAYLLGQLR